MKIRASVRLVLVAPLITFLVLTGVVASSLLFSSDEETVNALVAEQQTSILDATALRLDRFLEKPHLMNSVILRQIENDPSLVTDFPRMRRFLLGELGVFDTVMAGALGTEARGEFITAARHPGGGYDTAVFLRSESPLYRYYLMNAQGEVGKLLTTAANYDVRTRPWYQTGVAAGKAAWSPVYVFAANTTIGMTSVLPVRLHDRLLGVLQSALSFDFIDSYLNQIVLPGNHRIFLFDASGYLIGTSGGTKTTRKDSSGQLQRVKLQESEDSIVKAASALLTASGKVDQESLRTTREFSVGQARYLLRVRPYTDPQGLAWMIAVADDRQEFAARAERGMEANLVLGALATLLAIALGMFLVGRVTEPLIVLNKGVMALAGGDLSRKITVNGPTEVLELTSSFNTMASKIQELVTGLEDKVRDRTKDLETSLKVNTDLLREIHHRVKNNLQLVSGMLLLQEEAEDNEGLRQAFEEARNRIHSIALVHEVLSESAKLSTVDAAQYLTSLAKTAFSAIAADARGLSLEVRCESFSIDSKTASVTGLIVVELMTNSAKYAFPEKRGVIRIEARAQGSQGFVIIVSDDGKGVPEDFDPAKSDGLGTQLVVAFIKQLNGRYTIGRVKGTHWVMEFPVRETGGS